MNKSRKIALVSLLTLFVTTMTLSMWVTPSNGSSVSTPSWIEAGNFLNYKLNMNTSVAAQIPSSQYFSGGEFEFNITMSGTMNLLVNSLSNGNANVTYSPNLVLTETFRYPNGTQSLQSQSMGAGNATTFVVPLSSLGSNNLWENSNLSSFAGLSSFLSPNLNISVGKAPLGVYTWNGKSVPAIHFDSNITETQSLSLGQSLGSSGFHLNGTLNGYYTAYQDIPIVTDVNLTGSIAVGTINGTVDSSLELSLVNTNIDLGSGQVSQSTVNIPSYSSSLYVLSNSTLQSSSTSGNQLLLSVSGPSGTQGYVTVVISQRILNRSGITSTSQVQVTLDGQSYSNYSVTQVGGNYIIVVYYHHSSHNLAISLGNANLGTNTGSISGPGSPFLSGDMLYLIVGVVVAAVVIVGVFAATRSRGKTATPAPTSSEVS
jgi:hypothetical protein